MNPTERTLQVLEYLMAAGPGPVKQVDIARDCGLSLSTLNRIVKSLSEWGYLFRTTEKYCVRNFRLQRNVPMSEAYLAMLDRITRNLSHQLGVSAEVIVVAGHELLWHTKTEHPDENVIIRAKVGFRRSLYELDVLAQLYLSRMDWEDIQARFYVDGFFRTIRRPRQQMQPLPSAELKDILGNMQGKIFAADLKGNHVGIRRFATVIEDSEGHFLHLLALAEPASKEPVDVDHYRNILLSARHELTESICTSTAIRLLPKHHELPLKGG